MSFLNMINFLLLFGLLTTNFLSTNILIQSEQTIKENPESNYCRWKKPPGIKT